MKSNPVSKFVFCATALLLASLAGCGGGNENAMPASATLATNQPASAAANSHQSESESTLPDKN